MKTGYKKKKKISSSNRDFYALAEYELEVGKFYFINKLLK